jgi:hypothetical protein
MTHKKGKVIMNKRILIPVTTLLVAMLISSCGFQMVTGSGKVAAETRNVSGFTSVTLAGIGNVYLTQGGTESVRIEAEDNLIPYFDTSVQGTTLKIGLKDQYMGVSIRPTQPVKFYVTLPKIEAITLAGSGDMLAGKIQTDALKISLLGSGNISADSLAVTNLDINLAGSGDITLGTVSASAANATIAGSGDIQLDALTAQKITSKTAGSGNLIVSGKVSEQSAEILGSGDYQASGLKSDTGTVRVSGSGTCRVSVTGTLNVSVLGSGDVIYSGSPKVNASIAGSGNINRASE